MLELDGRSLACIGVQKHEEGYTHELSCPGGLALSMDGKAVAVADTGNNRHSDTVSLITLA